MSNKNLVLVICGHQGYIRHIDEDRDYGPENDILFSAISQTYLPLVNLLNKLKDDGISFKISLVLSPILCSLLSDAIIQEQYIQWLDRRIAFGEKEVLRLKGDSLLLKNAEACLEKAKQDKIDFEECYNRNLLREFSRLAKSGNVELLATAGSYAFLPHYSDMTEVLNAQIETGIYSHKYFFGSAPEGFWLPYMGYSDGIEKNLRSYGINYTILDSHGILFSKETPDFGIFKPVRSNNSLVLFARDEETPSDIENPEFGYMNNPVYKAQNRDVCFELSSSEIMDFIPENKARANSLYRYWAREKENSVVYDKSIALEQAKKDAISFLTAKNNKLNEAAKLVDGDVSLVCTLDASVLGQDWAEGIYWLENVIRENKESSFVSCSSLIVNQFKLPKITPYVSANSGTGYGEDLLDSSNSWMIRYTRKMGERMVDLAERFPSDTGLKARLLNLGAKELMLAQSAEWPKMIHDGNFPEYVEDYFKSCVLAFTAVFDSLGSNTVSTEWLTSLEKKHCLFPWMNYRIFSKKI